MKITAIKSSLSKFFRATGGQDLITYALVAGLAAVAFGVIIPRASKTVDRFFQKIHCSMQGGVPDFGHPKNKHGNYTCMPEPVTLVVRSQ